MMLVTDMDDKLPVPSENALRQSVYTKEDWPYTGVDEEIRDNKNDNKPYGPFHVWLYQLGLNINNPPDMAKSHLLLCILNFAALHDNKIDDTRDFMGFFWWYVEKIKPLSQYNSSEARKAAYHDLIVQILTKTNSLVIDLFSPVGDIYSVMLFPGNYAISDYAAIKIKLERIYIAIGNDPSAVLFEYDKLKELDEGFYNSLDDSEIYSTYIQEFFLYELTPEKILEMNGCEKFALIKVPTNQKILLPTEYLCQLAWLSFIKLKQCFHDTDGNIKNHKVLSIIISKVNRDNKKNYGLEFASELFKDPDSLRTEQDFWKLFLEGIVSSKPQELDGPSDMYLYAFLLGAVLPERSEKEAENAGITEVSVRENEIGIFYDTLCGQNDAEYTFASLMDMFRELPFAVRYRGNEKQFIEKALTVLIDSSKITKVREHTQKNITHFIVTKNLFPVFMHFIGTIRDTLLKNYPKEFSENKIKNEDEFRLDLEKKVFNGYPVFYQLYLNKEFAEHVFRLIEKMAPEAMEDRKKRLFISAAEKPSFLPLSELLSFKFDQFKSREAPPEHAVQEPAEEKGPPAQVETRTPIIDIKETAVRNAGTDINTGYKTAAPSADDAHDPDIKETDQTENGEKPLDFFEIINLIFNKIAAGFRSFFRVFSRTVNIAIEKDLKKKYEMIEQNKQRKERKKAAAHNAKAPAARTTRKANIKEPQQDFEISLQAIAKNMIEDFTGSKDLPLEEAINSLRSVWNDPKTLNQDESDYQKKENISKVHTLVRNGIQGTNLKQVNRAMIEERAQEIAAYKQIDEMIKNLVQRKENKEVIRRYIALCIISSFLNK